MAELNPKKIVEKEVHKLEKDTYAIIWIVFIAAILIMAFFFKQYLQDLVIVSVLFILFWYLEPVFFGATGKTVTTMLAKGRRVPKWKRFPLFFLAIILLEVVYIILDVGMEMAFPANSINIVFVIMWLGFLFLLWVFKLSKE